MGSKKWFTKALLTSGGVFAFVVFVFSAALDHTATASVAAGLCLALSILTADLESIEGFTIKAKLKDIKVDIDNAEIRVKGINNLFLAISRSSFTQIARGAISDAQRIDAVDDLTKSLQAAGIDQGEIDSAKSPIYLWIATGLYAVLTHIAANHKSAQIRLAEARRDSAPIPSAERDQATARMATLSEPWGHHNRPEIGNLGHTRKLLRSFVDAQIGLNENEQRLFEAISARLSDAFEESYAFGNCTPRALDLMKNRNVITEALTRLEAAAQS